MCLLAQAQRQLQLTLEAHQRYINSLIQREGLQGRLSADDAPSALAALGASTDGIDALAGPLEDPKGLPEPWGSAATSAGPSSGVQTHASLPTLPDFGQGLGGGRRGGAIGSVLGSGLGCSGLGSASGASASAGDDCLRALGGMLSGALGLREADGGGLGLADAVGGGGAWAAAGGGGAERASAASPMALPPGSHYVLGGGVGELGSPGLLLSQDLQARACPQVPDNPFARSRQAVQHAEPASGRRHGAGMGAVEAFWAVSQSANISDPFCCKCGALGR